MPRGGAPPAPVASEQLDHEGDLAVVVGYRGVRVQEAPRHLAGRACMNHARPGGIGPWLATADEPGGPAGLAHLTRPHGTEGRRDSTGRIV